MTAVSAEPFIEAAANLFDALVPVASDDELFASGYLRGHFDLAVGTLEVAAQPFSAADVVQQVNDTLHQAIANGELSQQDQQHVDAIWQRLQQLTA
ncbi:YfcL family protein [Rheinheimera pleomorphica]|uniref:YfcL family protein n=1 Tax=Rheinheimera pleomorphica TaxID=2703963 RepID=UPI001420F11B|nr:YfcL family protein [Rheinheimera pleomorphica]